MYGWPWLPLILMASGGVGGEIQWDSYLVRWWGTEGSKMGRPIYRMAVADNGLYRLHYGIMPGRPLDDYTLPYWPIRSFLSVVNGPVELAYQCQVRHSDQAEGFLPRSGVEIAEWEEGILLKVTNRSLASPENVTIPEGEADREACPCMVEHVFHVKPRDPVIQVLTTVTNVSDHTLNNVDVLVHYEHRFHWSHREAGQGDAFWVYSSGMERGYEIKAEEGCQLQHEAREERNRWQVRLRSKEAVDLPAGAKHCFSHSLRTLTTAPPEPYEAHPLTPDRVSGVPFRRVQPTRFRPAPVDRSRRVSLAEMFDALHRPKARGLTLRGPWSAMVKDVEALREWSGNLVILGLGPPETVAEVIQRGHHLGMEMFLAGRGSYREGSPKFDAYYASNPENEAIPDSHGQDEDHYYWDSISPSLDFVDLLGKPMANATQEERLTYWAQCFVQKWQEVREAVEPHAPGRGIWFYAPFPSIAHVDPLDHYDLFLKHLSSLGEDLTVLPFYYGVEYTQAEYMVRRWKDAGASRVVFLPMRDFYTRPSHFFRVISAARRGGADGTCGFHFHVTASAPEDEWQWKSVMLAAQCNFPTPELQAFCLLEEPAELLEELAERPHLPVVKRIHSPGEDPLIDSILAKAPEASKGFLQVTDNAVHAIGKDDKGVEEAMVLLSRFQALAMEERAR